MTISGHAYFGLSYTIRASMVIIQIMRVAFQRIFRSSFGRRLLAVCLLAHGLAGWLLVPLPAAAQDWGLFGTQETAFQDISPFQKWTGMLERYETQRGEQENLCRDRHRQAACVLSGWLERLDDLRGKPRLEQLQQVNAEMNALPYIEDIVNWGINDYWETPIEFLQRSGDCEDYSIAKYKSLRLLGVPARQMRIVVLNDMNLQVLHAVLAVEQEGTIYLLDNQIKELVDSKRVYHYMPIYSINEEGWWRHQPRNL